MVSYCIVLCCTCHTLWSSGKITMTHTLFQLSRVLTKPQTIGTLHQPKTLTQLMDTFGQSSLLLYVNSLTKFKTVLNTHLFLTCFAWAIFHTLYYWVLYFHLLYSIVVHFLGPRLLYKVLGLWLNLGWEKDKNGPHWDLVPIPQTLRTEALPTAVYSFSFSRLFSLHH